MKLQTSKLGKVAITVDKDIWSSSKAYDRLVVAEHPSGICYISRKRVPIGTSVENREYWIPLGKTSTTVHIADFTILQSINQLPGSYNAYEGPYLIDGIAYFWVGTNGNVKDEKYQSIAIQGEKGEDGKSAYEIWLENGGDPEVTEAEWVDSLKGEKGEQGNTGPRGERGLPLTFDDLTDEQKASLKGDPLTFADLTPEQIAALKGAKGDTGENGKSAYDLAMERRIAERLPVISMIDWLNSLQGLNGLNGDVITSISYNGYTNKLMFYINHYTRSGVTPVVRECQMPSNLIPSGGGDATPAVITRVEQVLELHNGSLADAVAYAKHKENEGTADEIDYTNVTFQWILEFYDGSTLVRKVIWHVADGNYTFIDANGYIMYTEETNS